MNTDAELGRWKDSLEQNSLLLIGSEQPLRKEENNNKLEDDIPNFQRMKPRDALEIEFQVSSTKPQTSNTEEKKRALF